MRGFFCLNFRTANNANQILLIIAHTRANLAELGLLSAIHEITKIFPAPFFCSESCSGWATPTASPHRYTVCIPLLA